MGTLNILQLDCKIGRSKSASVLSTNEGEVSMGGHDVRVSKNFLDGGVRRRSW